MNGVSNGLKLRTVRIFVILKNFEWWYHPLVSVDVMS
jgi:hypothetical protein